MTAKEKNPVDLKQAIDHRPMTLSQWLIVAMATILMMTEGYDVQAMAFASTAVEADLGLNASQLGLALSAGLVGMMIGTATIGPLADRFGRRPVLLVALLANLVFMLLTATSSSIAELLTWRVLTGIAIGGTLTTGIVLVSEFANVKYRALALAIYSSGFPIGATIGGLVAVPVIANYSWQGVFLLGGFITLAAVVAVIFIMPESIDTLAIRHHKGDAKALPKTEAIARRLGITGQIQLPPVNLDKGNSTNTYKRLFTPEYRGRTLKLWVVYFLVLSCFYFVSSWTPRLMTEIGLTAEQGIYGGMTIMAGGIVGNVFYGLCSARWDPRRVMAVFGLITAGLMVTFASTTSWVGIALTTGLILGAFINGCMAGLYTLAPRSYPADMRSTGVGTAMGVGRIGSVIAPALVGWLLETGLTPISMFIGFAVVIVVPALLAPSLAQHRDVKRVD